MTKQRTRVDVQPSPAVKTSNPPGDGEYKQPDLGKCRFKKKAREIVSKASLLTGVNALQNGSLAVAH